MPHITLQHLHAHLLMMTEQMNKDSEQLSHILNKQNKIMATLTELQQAVSDLQTSVDTKQAAIAQAIADLEAQITAGGGAASEAELQAVVDSLKATQTDVEGTPTA